MKFGILKDLTSPIILGQDFMMKYRTTLEFKPIPSITLSPPVNLLTKHTKHPPQYRRLVPEYKKPLLKPVRETTRTRQRNVHQAERTFQKKRKQGSTFYTVKRHDSPIKEGKLESEENVSFIDHQPNEKYEHNLNNPISTVQPHITVNALQVINKEENIEVDKVTRNSPENNETKVKGEVLPSKQPLTIINEQQTGDIPQEKKHYRTSGRSIKSRPPKPKLLSLIIITVLIYKLAGHM